MIEKPNIIIRETIKVTDMHDQDIMNLNIDLIIKVNMKIGITEITRMIIIETLITIRIEKTTDIIDHNSLMMNIIHITNITIREIIAQFKINIDNKFN